MNIGATGVRFLLSLAVPVALLVIGGLGRTLIISELRWSNFYLGTDFALAGIAAGLLNFLEVTDVSPKIYWTVGYVVITIGIYMVVLCMHQNIEKRQLNAQSEAARRRQRAGTGMGFLANFIGLAPSFLFAWFKLKGSL